MNLLVTALFNLYPEARDRLGIDFRISCLNRMIECGADIVVFVEDWLIGRVSHRQNAKIIQIELADVETYRRIVNASPKLPAGRNQEKDTLQYLALMASKFELLKLAQQSFQKFDHYTWIDAGIPKLFDDDAELARKVNALDEIKCDKIISALGTYPPLHPSSFQLDSPYWRFLGGLFVFPSSLLGKLTSTFDGAVTGLLDAGLMTWEVNIIAHIESENRELFSGYIADHNATILNVQTEYLG